MQKKDTLGTFFFEQLDLAEPKVTAVLLYKQIEFLFTKQFFSVKPRSSNNMIACIHAVRLLLLHGTCTGLMNKPSLGTVTCHCTSSVPHKAAKLIAVRPDHRTEFYPQKVTAALTPLL